MPKNYSGTYIYSKNPDYDKNLFSYIMRAEEIDKESPGFEDIIFEVKRRQVGSSLPKVLKSDAVVLLVDPKGEGAPRQFKAFCAKDVRNGSKKNLKVYIDCTGLITKSDKSGEFRLKEVDIFISYLVSAMTNYIYYKDDKRFINNAIIVSAGAKAFADLMLNVVDSVAKLASASKYRAYVKYMAACYYISNILQRDYTTPGNISVARKIAGLSDREADIVDMQLESNSFDNILFFVRTMAEVIRVPKLSTESVVSKWTFVYGRSTPFGLELFPAFATMLSDCYVGAYINNQKTIEKIAGQSMVEFVKSLLAIGAEAV